MKVLLIGEYSGLHNTLKEGLVAIGHEVILVGDGDGFKNFPSDYSIRPTFLNQPIIKWFKLGIYKIFGYDLLPLERGIRFSLILKNLKGFDAVQLINEKPIKTIPFLERYFLKQLVNTNTKVFLLSCGVDTFSLRHLLNKQYRYSLLDPYFKDPNLKETYDYILKYDSKSHNKTHKLLLENIRGILASDIDYVLPLKGHPLFLGLHPNPINLEKIAYNPLRIDSEIKLFLGINRGNQHQKGIIFFENALTKIKEKYKDKVSVITAENIPYKEYINLYDSAHIVLDQVYSYDQGYNALEAMAKGKVVFTGAEVEFLDHYNLQDDEVCINALPDVEYLVNKLSWLIENPEKILEIGQNARKFIEREHEYKKIAQKYVTTFNS
jgi:glycosyltransferase involved in cell wall biosynthesis